MSAAQSPEGTLFRKYQTALVKQLGRKALYNEQIDNIGKSLFKSHWGGCHPSDWKNLKPNKFYVFNTDPSNKPGLHWLGGITTKTNLYLYDSYARQAPLLVKNLSQHAKKLGFKVPIQPKYSRTTR